MMTARIQNVISSTEQAAFYPSPQCLIDQIQVQKTFKFVATDPKPDHT